MLLCSVSCHWLIVPWHHRGKLGRWTFSAAGPTTWNSLPAGSDAQCHQLQISTEDTFYLLDSRTASASQASCAMCSNMHHLTLIFVKIFTISSTEQGCVQGQHCQGQGQAQGHWSLRPRSEVFKAKATGLRGQCQGHATLRPRPPKFVLWDKGNISGTEWTVTCRRHRCGTHWGWWFAPRAWDCAVTCLSTDCTGRCRRPAQTDTSGRWYPCHSEQRTG